MAVTRAHADFILTYRGPALESHRMPVAELAPSLLALGQIFHEANGLVNPAGPKVSLEVRAHEGGSFEVALALGHIEGMAGELTRVLAGPDATALANLITYITVGGGSLFAVVKWLGRHKAVRREEVAPGVTRFVSEEGDAIDVPAEVVELLQRPSIRKQARRVVAPLEREGIDSLQFERGDDNPVVVEAKDVDAFDLPALPETSITDQETEMSLAITVLAFGGNRKWRLSDGSMTFSADMEDREFLQRIELDEERFSKGDILRCRVRVQQWQTDSGLRTEYAIVDVLEHRIPSRSLPLPFDQDRSPTISSTDQT